MTDEKNWKTLEWKHGPLIPAKYQPLKRTGPEPLKLFKYNKNYIPLSPKAEEAALFYVRYMDSNYVKNQTFNENFFESWRDDWMSKAERNTITEWKKCDFKTLKRFVEKKKEKMTSAEKKRRERKREKHSICIVDGKEQKISNFIEPPGIYIGRGDNIYLGRLKKRVEQKDIILNCSLDKAPKGNWQEVVCQPHNAWVAKYRNIDFQGRSQFKFIWLSNEAPSQKKKDQKKYDNAQKLGTIIDKIRSDYGKDLKSNDERLKQIGAALYLIDKLSLRVGHEKGADETDTVGCCTLRKDNITMKKDGKSVYFNFIGKDSISFERTVEVPPDVYNVLKWCKNRKSSDGQLFSIKADDINDRLKEYKDWLSAKVFRTYNASLLLEEELKRKCSVKSPSPEDVKMVFTKANVKVAKLCNHQKANGRTCENKLKRLTLQITETRVQIKDARSRRETRKRERLENKLMRLQKQESLAKLIGPYALETSKTNYLDPRIVFAWCKENKFPVEQIYSKKLLLKFKWAAATTKSYSFSTKR